MGSVKHFFIYKKTTSCLSLLCTSPAREPVEGVCPAYGWRCWGESGTGVVQVGGCRSTSLRERDCLAREEPRRRDECRSTRALSLRVTFLLKEGEVEEGRGGGGSRIKRKKENRDRKEWWWWRGARNNKNKEEKKRGRRVDRRFQKTVKKQKH